MAPLVPVLVAFATSLVLAAAQAEEEGPVVETPHGKVRGVTLRGTHAWRGVPFAAPPLGDRRFRPPQPPLSWSGIRPALDYGPSCLQMGSPSVGGYGKAWNSLNLTSSSEDCLYLNVFSPENASQPLPVMVYLHAGEFRFGSPHDSESDWPYFAHGSVVLVTAGFRLGLFGFAALDALRARDPSGSSGNYAMQDQRAALQWVQDSIHAFGGDPERVTIFGESSGGASVAFHVFSTRSNGLFKRAILESPGLTQSKSWSSMSANTLYAASGLTAAGSKACSWPSSSSWKAFPGMQASGPFLGIAKSGEEARRQCGSRKDCFLISVDENRTAKLFGFADPGRSVSVYLFNETLARGRNPGVNVQLRLPDMAGIVDCMVAADAADLVNLNIAPLYDDTFYTDAAAPTEDGVELPAPLSTMVQGPPPKSVALLAGSNQDEGTMFMSECPNIPCNATEAVFEKWAVKMYGPELGPKVPPVYQELDMPTPLCSSRMGAAAQTSKAWVAAMRSAGDDAILCRTRELLRGAHRRGNKAWWYYFTATPIYSVNEPQKMMPYMGAFHGAEVPFVFGDEFELKSDGEKRLSRAMGCYWTNFAATGNPNRGPSGCASALSLPEWPAFDEGSTAITFSNTSIGVRKGLKKTQCDVFAQYSHSRSRRGQQGHQPEQIVV